MCGCDKHHDDTAPCSCVCLEHRNFEAAYALAMTRFDEIKELREETQALREDVTDYVHQTGILADLLTRTANALKGTPPPLTSHSWHDLPEVADRMRRAVPPPGWFAFGYHADHDPVPAVEFSEVTGEDGLPLWERPTAGAGDG